MEKNILALIGGCILIGSLFLPILSINTTYKGYSILFNYWIIGLMQADVKNHEDFSGMGFEPNVIGIGCAVLLLIFGIIIIVKSIREVYSRSIVIYGIFSIIVIIGITTLMYVALVNAMKDSEIVKLSTSLFPSFGVFTAIIGGILSIIGGIIKR